MREMNGIISKDAEISIAASSMFPGFRFSPTDEELILYYLKKKLDGFDKCVEVIPEVDICKFEPWDLPAKAIIKSDQEWFFFSPRGKKYPNGSQSKRATEIGYWKATGKERAVKSGSNLIGTKRTLVFHIGRAPRGERTEWIMHEYCMAGKGQDALVVCRLRRKCDYHGIDGSNGEIHFPKPLSMRDSSGTNSTSGLDIVGASGEGKMADGSLKKCSSSHDSHSVEQMDSAAESDLKFRDETMQPESSSHQRGNEEDDLFADILNDNIVQLDECPASLHPPVQQMHTSTVSVVPRVYSQPGQPIVPRGYPSQGTANRRIRLRKLRRSSAHKDELKEGSGENMVSPKSNQAPKRFMGIKTNCSHLYMVVIILTLVILLVSFGGFGASLYVSWPKA